MGSIFVCLTMLAARLALQEAALMRFNNRGGAAATAGASAAGGAAISTPLLALHDDAGSAGSHDTDDDEQEGEDEVCSVEGEEVEDSQHQEEEHEEELGASADIVVQPPQLGLADASREAAHGAPLGRTRTLADIFRWPLGGIRHSATAVLPPSTTAANSAARRAHIPGLIGRSPDSNVLSTSDHAAGVMFHMDDMAASAASSAQHNSHTVALLTSGHDVNLHHHHVQESRDEQRGLSLPDTALGVLPIPQQLPQGSTLQPPSVSRQASGDHSVVQDGEVISSTAVSSSTALHQASSSTGMRTDQGASRGWKKTVSFSRSGRASPLCGGVRTGSSEFSMGIASDHQHLAELSSRRMQPDVLIAETALDSNDSAKGDNNVQQSLEQSDSSSRPHAAGASSVPPRAASASSCKRSSLMASIKEQIQQLPQVVEHGSSQQQQHSEPEGEGGGTMSPAGLSMRDQGNDEAGMEDDVGQQDSEDDREGGEGSGGGSTIQIRGEHPASSAAVLLDSVAAGGHGSKAMCCICMERPIQERDLEEAEAVLWGVAEEAGRGYEEAEAVLWGVAEEAGTGCEEAEAVLWGVAVALYLLYQNAMY
ncbi:hypothetical protein CEUSTIGMA_g4745.t1 [Chlamydomonas eustigma]|uniref:Uncharacterized protein n=1 Tax=Chlamydomonas eustigma TaxID=1157962 RepID=A0A250X2Z0_9CHLO|nr:hypothetical protein CEUSTIGMA_g4745.t1 [Chlamydomonas eustigma]|eukprot:GAX77299.1 hypothetical protein CEUSTIGMA_g4745.t1 [Chlamydomonas eustigma]